MKPTTMAVCMDCWNQGEGFYLPVAEAGKWCDNDHDGKHFKLVKRRLYICAETSCEQLGFTTLGEYKRHKKRDHDDWLDPEPVS